MRVHIAVDILNSRLTPAAQRLGRVAKKEGRNKASLQGGEGLNVTALAQPPSPKLHAQYLPDKRGVWLEFTRTIKKLR